MPSKPKYIPKHKNMKFFLRGRLLKFLSYYRALPKVMFLQAFFPFPIYFFLENISIMSDCAAKPPKITKYLE